MKNFNNGRKSLVDLAKIILLFGSLIVSTFCFAESPSQISNIFKPESTPADSIFNLSILVLIITGVIFLIVGSLIVYSITKFRKRRKEDNSEPPQVYGSNQVETAWTIIPIFIVIILVLASARVIHSVQDAPQPPNSVEVTAIGHQFWWEFRYPDLGVVTANELHVPVSNLSRPAPTFLTLLSADTVHSFWIPQLAGKTDLLPNRINRMWIEPHKTGMYLGQCAQYCGRQHAKMLLRVYVDSNERFNEWIQEQKQPAATISMAAEGRRIFESTACLNCHAVTGTVATGRFGPDLTHLMSRDTIASGAAENNADQLKIWLRSPDHIKPGSLMPAMNVNEHDLAALTEYLMTLK
jgi:cytochrome c oxidase subunit 2